MPDIQQNYQTLVSAIQSINSNAQLCVVTKTQPVESILQAIQAGATIIGENRVQEAESKFDQIPSSVEKHLIGHLQKNKVKKAVRLFDVIQSVDSVKLAAKINRECESIEKIMPIMLEVNTSEETQKNGFLPHEVLEATQTLSQFNHLKIIGLMTVAKHESNPDNCRPSFQLLKELSQEIKDLKLKNIEMKHLSMGMTNDYPVALEEGSTIVRVGSGTFGRRK